MNESKCNCGDVATFMVIQCNINEIYFWFQLEDVLELSWPSIFFFSTTSFIGQYLNLAPNYKNSNRVYGGCVSVRTYTMSAAKNMPQLHTASYVRMIRVNKLLVNDYLNDENSNLILIIFFHSTPLQKNLCNNLFMTFKLSLRYVDTSKNREGSIEGVRKKYYQVANNYKMLTIERKPRHNE